MAEVVPSELLNAVHDLATAARAVLAAIPPTGTGREELLSLDLALRAYEQEGGDDT